MLIHTRDRLGSTVFFAVVLHGVLILGVTFGNINFRGAEDSSSLRVTVVVPTDRTTAPDADILAQVDSLGSGTLQQSVDPAAPRRDTGRPAAARPDQGSDPETTLPGRPQASPDVLAARTGEREIQALPEPSERHDTLPRLARADDDPDRPVSRLLTDDDRLEISAPERELLLGPDTRADEAAAYLAAWRSRVERIGTRHFPAGLPGQPGTGNPVLEVSLRADGTLADIVIKRSSGHGAIDQAALDILRLASPFEPFEAALAQRYDSLRFAYEWRFDGLQ
ncbi:MAG: TonB family protein [Gammaproteobacteria bacterium]|nr:MAG: TonB family protein [Gammaproteobacteria bacterium]